MEGGATGEARLTQTVQPGGGKTVRLVATIRRTNQAVEVRTEATYDAKGSPLRKLQSYGSVGKAAAHQTIVTFDAEGAHAVVRERGGSQTHDLKLPAAFNRANAAETWFVTVRPKRGDVAKAHTFDPEALEWVATATTYVGPESKGHRLRIVRGERTTEALVDDRGIPIEVQEGALRLVRRPG